MTMMVVNLPTLLTLLRIFIIPLLIIAFYSSEWVTTTNGGTMYCLVHWSAVVCAGLFTLAAITDVLDGYIARRFEQVTRFGALIDPIADKMIVAVALLLIVERVSDWLVTLPALVIITREFAIAGLREWMTGEGCGDLVAVNWLGKTKMVIQVFAIIFLLWGVPPATGMPISTTGNIGLLLLYLAAAMTLLSMIMYLLKARHVFNK